MGGSTVVTNTLFHNRHAVVLFQVSTGSMAHLVCAYKEHMDTMSMAEYHPSLLVECAALICLYMHMYVELKRESMLLHGLSVPVQSSSSAALISNTFVGVWEGGDLGDGLHVYHLGSMC